MTSLKSQLAAAKAMLQGKALPAPAPRHSIPAPVQTTAVHQDPSQGAPSPDSPLSPGSQNSHQLAPLPSNLADHKWLNVRSNFHFLRVRPQGVGKQWRVHDLKMYDAVGTNICTDPTRIKSSGTSAPKGRNQMAEQGYWEAPDGSLDNSWLRYDLPSSQVVWRVETRSSAEPGRAPANVVLEGSRDGKEWVSVAYTVGEKVKPQRIYKDGKFVMPYAEEILHRVSL